MWISDKLPTSAQKPVLTAGNSRVNPLLPTGKLADVIQASVSRQLDKGIYELLYNGRRLTALSDRPLDVGRSYSLRVTGHDEQGRLFTTFSTRPPAAIQPALQLRLARQQDPTQLLATLASRAQAGALPQDLAAAVLALPQRSDVIDPRRLAERFLRSGLFLEALLAAGAPAANADLKALLLRLRAWLQGQPPARSISDREPGRQADSSPPRVAVPKAYQGAHLHQPFSFSPRTLAEPGSLDTLAQWLRSTEAALARVESQQLIALQAREAGHTLAGTAGFQ